MKNIVLITISLFLASCTQLTADNTVAEIQKAEDSLDIDTTNNAKKTADLEYVRFDTPIKDLSYNEFALRMCLIGNYRRQAGKTDLKDSGFLEDFSPVAKFTAFTVESEFGKFVSERTKDFYREHQSELHLEVSKPPHNAIFSRCMEFYNSQELDDYINDMP